MDKLINHRARARAAGCAERFAGGEHFAAASAGWAARRRLGIGCVPFGRGRCSGSGGGGGGVHHRCDHTAIRFKIEIRGVIG